MDAYGVKRAAASDGMPLEGVGLAATLLDGHYVTVSLGLLRYFPGRRKVLIHRPPGVFGLPDLISSIADMICKSKH